MQQRLERRRDPRGWSIAVLALALTAAAGYRGAHGDARTGTGPEPESAGAAAAVESAPVRESLPALVASSVGDPAERPADGQQEPNLSATVAASDSVGPGQAPATSVGAAGVRAFIDPATGKLTANPTRAQLQSLALQPRATTSSRSTVGLRPFPLSRGGRGLNLQGRFQTAMRVERAADGSFHLTCGDGGHDEEAHLHAAGVNDGQPTARTSTAAPEQ